MQCLSMLIWYLKMTKVGILSCAHYFLTVGREFLKMRDGQRVQTQKEKKRAVWTPDLNKGQMSASVAAFQNLGILELLNPAREFRASDEDLQQMAEVVKNNRHDIKSGLNISANQKDTPIAISSFLKLGFKLTF